MVDLLFFFFFLPFPTNSIYEETRDNQVEDVKHRPSLQADGVRDIWIRFGAT